MSEPSVSSTTVVNITPSMSCPSAATTLTNLLARLSNLYIPALAVVTHTSPLSSTQMLDGNFSFRLSFIGVTE